MLTDTTLDNLVAFSPKLDVRVTHSGCVRCWHSHSMLVGLYTIGRNSSASTLVDASTSRSRRCIGSSPPTPTSPTVWLSTSLGLDSPMSECIVACCCVRRDPDSCGCLTRAVPLFSTVAFIAKNCPNLLELGIGYSDVRGHAYTMRVPAAASLLFVRCLTMCGRRRVTHGTRSPTTLSPSCVSPAACCARPGCTGANN